MENQKNYLALVSCLIVLATAGCSKDDPFEGLTTEQKLMAHPWQLTKAEIRIEGKWEDYGEFDPCDFDDVYTFLNSDSLLINHGLNKCFEWEQETEVDAWEMLPDQSGFTILGGALGCGGCEYRFEKLADKELQVTTQFFATQPERYTFSKQ